MGYKEGEAVYFDFGNGIKGVGKVRGLAWQGVINMWIVELNEPLSDAYEWSCTVVPEGCLEPVVKHSTKPPPPKDDLELSEKSKELQRWLKG